MYTFEEEKRLDYEFNNLIANYQIYNQKAENVDLIIKAYDLAKKAHKGVRRKSGEPYMYHPLAVAKIAVFLKMDAITICTCILHDVVEDTEYTYDDIAEIFNKIVADNVNSVTKMTKENYNNPLIDAHIKTMCKLFRHLNYVDVRGPGVKLFDRLHNMRTLDAMKPEKQLEKSQECMEFYAPLAQSFGVNAIKKELQDLAFKYINPLFHLEIKETLKFLKEKQEKEIEFIKDNIHQKLLKEGINNKIKLRVKNIYSVYISLEKGRDYDNIHDLYALQIDVDKIRDCFLALNIIHDSYPYFDKYFKDYIHNPKTTGYKALHTTFVSPTNRMYQAQIRTKEMGYRNSYGILYGLDIKSEEDLENLKLNYPFFEKLKNLDEQYPEDDLTFYSGLKYDLLGDKIYVFSPTGHVYSLPVGSTIVDYAYCICPNRAQYLVKGKINGEIVDISTQLKNQDLVDFTSNTVEPFNPKVLESARTIQAKKLILDRMSNHGK